MIHNFLFKKQPMEASANEFDTLLDITRRRQKLKQYTKTCGPFA